MIFHYLEHFFLLLFLPIMSNFVGFSQIFQIFVQIVFYIICISIQHKPAVAVTGLAAHLRNTLNLTIPLHKTTHIWCLFLWFIYPSLFPSLYSKCEIVPHYLNVVFIKQTLQNKILIPRLAVSGSACNANVRLAPLREIVTTWIVCRYY